MMKTFKFFLLFSILTIMLGCGGGSSSGSFGNSATTINDPPQNSCSTIASLPFAHKFGADQKLYAVVNRENFLAEFGAWATNGAGHSGHIEGDGKTNYSVFIRPAALLAEFSNHVNNPSGNNDGVCNTNEICGVTATSAINNAPWYVVQHDNTLLFDVRYDGSQDVSEYVLGENPSWTLTFKTCDLYFNIGHVGELSAALQSLLIDRFGSAITSRPGSVDFSSLYSNPISLKQSMTLARPQVTYSFQASINGQRLYYAHAQIEWNVDEYANYNSTNRLTSCAYNLFGPSDKNSLQSALTQNLLDPEPFGRFLAYGNRAANADGTADIYSTAFSALCTSSTHRNDDFSQVSVSDSYSWIDGPMGSSEGEVVTIFPIQTNTDTYDSVQDHYFSSNTNHMILRGFGGTSRNSFTLTDGTTTYTLTKIAGELINFSNSATKGSFIIRMSNGLTEKITGNNSVNSALDGKFLGVRFKLEDNRLLIHWGQIYGTQAAVILPSAIPNSVICNGSPTFCYDHDINTLNF